MNQKLRPSEEDLRAIVGGFHPQERFIITFKVSAGITDLAAFGELATARHIKILPDTLLPAVKDTDGSWKCVRSRQRVFRVLPLFEWQAFAAALDYAKIENIVPFE
jgi:hypothetical protein